MKRLLRLLSLALVAGLFATGCAGSADPTEYSQETRDNFIDACEEGNSTESAVAGANIAAFCQCTYGKIETTMVFADFVEVDDLLDEKAGDEILALDQLPAVADPYLAAIASCLTNAE